MTQMDDCGEMKMNNCIKQQMAKANAETQAASEDKGGKKLLWADERASDKREDRTRWLRKMLFNLCIKPGLVVFTLIYVFIDFVFNFNLLSTSLHYHPTHQAYYTLQRDSSL